MKPCHQMPIRNPSYQDHAKGWPGPRTKSLSSSGAVPSRSECKVTGKDVLPAGAAAPFGRHEVQIILVALDHGSRFLRQSGACLCVRLCSKREYTVARIGPAECRTKQTTLPKQLRRVCGYSIRERCCQMWSLNHRTPLDLANYLFQPSNVQFSAGRVYAESSMITMISQFGPGYC